MVKKITFLMALWLLLDFKIAYNVNSLVVENNKLFEAEKLKPKGNGGGSIPLPCFVNQRAWPLESLVDVSHVNEKYNYTLYCDL